MERTKDEDIMEPCHPAARRLIKALEHQEGGNHYKQFQIEPLEFLARNRIPFAEGNIIKYVCRHRFKGGVEDLKKAMHYLEVLIEAEYGESPTA